MCETWKEVLAATLWDIEDENHFEMKKKIDKFLNAVKMPNSLKLNNDRLCRAIENRLIKLFII